MKGAARDQEFGPDASMDEPPRVLHIFFDEQVDRTDADPRRRQPGDSGHAGGYGCCRHFGRTRWNTEQRAPGKTIGTCSPYKVANGRRWWVGTARPVVERGIDEQLKNDGHFVAVARVNRKAGCVGPARALTSHGNSGAINAKLRRMGMDPFERGVIVLERPGIARLWSQPVVNRDDDAMAIGRDPLDLGH